MHRSIRQVIQSCCRRGGRGALFLSTVLLLFASWLRESRSDDFLPPTLGEFPTVIMAKECVKNPEKSCLNSDCHQRETKLRQIEHQPYLEAQCKRCHVAADDASASRYRSNVRLVCLGCHEDIKKEAEKNNDLHVAGDRVCTTCHKPHAGSIRNLLRDEKLLGACADCHKDFLEESAKLPFRHRHFELRSQCGDCHYAHRQGENYFLRENAAETCMTCHDMPIVLDGRVLPNVVRQISNAQYVHGALKYVPDDPRKRSCPACHTPHGSGQKALLQSDYPAGNYTEYKEENYGLCFACHPKDLVEDGVTATATKFRNGPVNLHRRHLVELKQGRACHLCHEAHVAERPYLLRERIEYGDWKAPLGFVESVDGASCVTPCHKTKSYSRKLVPEELEDESKAAPAE